MRMLHPTPLAHLRAGRKTPRTAQVLLWRHQSLPRQCADNIGPLILLDNKANTLFGSAVFAIFAKHCTSKCSVNTACLNTVFNLQTVKRSHFDESSLAVFVP